MGYREIPDADATTGVFVRHRPLGVELGHVSSRNRIERLIVHQFLLLDPGRRAAKRTVFLERRPTPIFFREIPVLLLASAAKMGQRVTFRLQFPRFQQGPVVEELSLFDPFDKQDGLRGRSLVGRTFIDLDLAGANLTDVDFGSCLFVRTNLSGASCVGSSFDGARFTDCSLRGIDGRNTSFRTADLRNCKLEGAQLINSDLRGANLSLAVLTPTLGYPGTTVAGANLGGCLLRKTKLNGVTYNSQTIFPARFHAFDRGMLKCESPVAMAAETEGGCE